MDIREFFKLCEGQWVSQRTLHHIQTEKTDVGKADLWIETVESSSNSVVDACQKFGLSVEHVFCPLEVTHKTTLINGQLQINSTLMVPVLQEDSVNGQLISIPQEGQPILGAFSLGTDEVMTFTHPQGSNSVSERVWYASENLRIRSITLVDTNGPSEANFCSEIRRMGKPLPKPTGEEQVQPLSSLAAWRSRQAGL